ncbi:MAG: tetratricopeptide repeat protein [Methylococcaceae bacterium]|jgi:predicted negative regulator of RcsB-dependent stress response
MELYETEEQQVEALQKWWKENATASFIGLGIAIATILGWNAWLDYKKEEAGKASAVYDQLLKDINENKVSEIDTVATKLKTEFGSTEYATYSILLQAKTKVESGDLAAAKELLQGLANQSSDLNQLAKLRLVRLYLATGEYEKGLQLIGQVNQKTAAGFEDNYDELVGDLYIALDRLDEARTSYEKALRNGYQSPLLQFKLDDLTAPEKLENTK